jgi:hypothetical protein
METTNDTPDITASRYCVMGPSISFNADYITRSGHYRLIPHPHRYRNEGESNEEFDAYIDSITLMHLPDTSEGLDKAVEVMRMWNTVGATWDDSTTTPPTE